MKQKTEWEECDMGNAKQLRWISTENPSLMYLGFSCDARWINCYGVEFEPMMPSEARRVLGDLDETKD